MAILVVLAVAPLMGVLDFSIVNVALPSIQREFALTAADLQWVVSAFALTFAGFLLLGGRIADIFDRKVVFMSGLAIFSAASLMGGLSPSAQVIWAARAVQGIGAAILAPVALALVMTTFHEREERNRALALFGTIAAVGFTAGVVLGALLTGLASWRWIFFVNVPVGLTALLAAAWLLPRHTTSSPRRRLDLAGSILGTVGLVALVAGLTRLGVRDSEALPSAVLIGTGIALLTAFVAVERSTEDAVLPLWVLRLPLIGSANLVAALTMAVASGLAFTLTLVVQQVMGYSPLATGAAFLPAGVGGIVGGTLAGRGVMRMGLRLTALTALATLAAGTALVLGFGLNGSIGWLAAGYGVAGIGIVGTAVTSMIAATNSIGRERQGLAAGLLSTSQQMGGGFGVALVAVIGAAATLPAYRSSLIAVFALLAVAALVVATRFVPTAGRSGLGLHQKSAAA